MHEGLTVVARYFNRTVRQTVRRRTTRRQPDATVGNIDGKATDPGNSTGEFKLRGAFGQSLLGLLPSRDVTGHAKQPNRIALGIAHNRSFRRDPPRLAGVAMTCRVDYPVFGGPYAAGAPCLCEGSIYAHPVVGMNETPRVSDRCGLQVVSMNQGSAGVALEPTGSKVRAECTQFRSVKGQLKALIAPIEQRFMAAPLSEQRGEKEGQHCTRQDDGLRSKYAVCESDVRVSKMSYTE